MSSDIAQRLEAVADFARKHKAMKVEIDGIKVEFDRDAFAEPAKEPPQQQEDPYDGVCPCGCDKADHNPSTGCANGCMEWKCSGLRSPPDEGQQVTAGQYG